MPHCCAFNCNNESTGQKNTGKDGKKVTFHRVPGEDKKELRQKWLIAIGRRQDNLPKFPHLCSDHFDPSCFDESVDLRNRLLGDKRRCLKDGAVPTIFSHKPAPKVRATSVARAAKRNRQEVRVKFDFVEHNCKPNRICHQSNDMYKYDKLPSTGKKLIQSGSHSDPYVNCIVISGYKL